MHVLPSMRPFKFLSKNDNLIKGITVYVDMQWNAVAMVVSFEQRL